MDKRKQNTENNKISKNKSNGITLIALVISIIVMLILAGVSLNATVGDNGIITKAVNATYNQSCAVLEEFLQQEYVNLYLDYNQNYEKLDIVRKNHGEYFYKPSQTGLSYILIDGHMYFLIDKEGLPTDISSQLQGGNAENKTYQDYANFKDVYGVTSDLKVYYCADGLDSRIGAIDELKEDDAAREAISSSSTSGLGSYLSNNFDWIKTDANGNILSDGMSSIKEFTIDSNEIKNLEELYNFSSLKKLYIKNANLETLSGIELCPKLEYVYIYNSTSQSYSNLSNVLKLKYLYFEGIKQETLDNCMNDLEGASFNELEYLGIYNTSLVNSIESLDKLSDVTKSNVKYLYLYNLGITSLNGISNYNSVKYAEIRNNGNMTSLTGLNVSNLQTLNAYSCSKLSDISALENATNLNSITIYSTAITNLNALENCNNINTINASSCKLGLNTDTTKGTNNALYALRNKNNLRYLKIENNSNLLYVDYIKDNPIMNELYLLGCNNLNPTEASYLKNIIKRCGTNYSLPTNLGLALIDDEINKLDLEGQTISVEQFEVIQTYTNIKYLCLKDLVLTKEGAEIDDSEYDIEINKVLSYLTNLETIQLNGIRKLNKINFVTSCQNITEIDLRNTNVTTNENGLILLNDNCPNIRAIVVNNASDDFSYIQTAISKMRAIGNSTGTWASKTNSSQLYGLYCQNQNALNTLSKCKNITRFYCGSHLAYTVDLRNCSKLTEVYVYLTSGGKIMLPTKETIKASILEEESKGIYTYSNDLEEISYTVSLIDTYNNSISGGYGCTSLSITHPYTTSSENFWNMIEGFRNSEKIEKVSFGFTSTTSAEYIKSTGLEVFSNCPNLKILEWKGRTVTPYKGNADDLSQLSNIKSLENIKFDYITASTLPDLSQLKGLKTVDISTSLLMDINGLKNCTSIENLYLNNNNIQDLSAIATLSNLVNLNLENNSITNSVTTITNGFVDNIKVLNDLKNTYNKLTNLYIAKNNIDDLSNLEWAKSK